MTPALEVRALTKRFGGLYANRDVSLQVPSGGVLGLVGPNGAGKTTLFNCITGYYPPSSGEVLLDGRRVDGLRPDRICKLGMARTWQKVRPLARMSVLENVMVGAFCRTRSVARAREAAREQLAGVGLTAKASAAAGTLSIGERKKLEVARILATRPRIVLFDEVMGGLNPTEREELIALILEIKRRGVTQVVIEHDMKAIMRVSDRVVVLNSGERLAEGAPQEIAANPRVIEAYLGQGASGA